MAAPRDIRVNLLGDADSFERAFKKANRQAAEFDKSTTKAHKSSSGLGAALKGGAVVGGVLALGKGLEDAAKAAAADETAMSRAGLAVKNAGEKWGKLKKPIDDSLTSMSEQSGFVKSELVSAFSKAETATGNHTKALHNLKLAEEISLQSGKPLVAVIQAVNKESMGSANALARYGVKALDVGQNVDALKAKYETLAQAQKGKLTPAQKDAEKAAMDHAKALDKTANAAATAASADTKYAGAIAAHSETMAGKVAIFHARWEEIQVRVGQVILPFIVTGLGMLMTAFGTLDGFIESNKTLMEVLGIAIGVLTAAFVIHAAAIKAIEIAQKAWAIATDVVTGAQWLLNAALDANPIGIVVIAIAGLVAALVVLYTQSGTARTIINEALGDIKRVGKDVVDWFKDTGLPSLGTAFEIAKTAVKLAIDPMIEEVTGIYTAFKGAYDLIRDLIHGNWSKAWDDAKTIATGVFEAIDGAMQGIPGKLGGKALEAVKGAAADIGNGIKNAIQGALQGLGGGLEAAIKGAVNVMIDAANSGINLMVDHWPDVPGLPGPGKFGLHHDMVPHLAAGGVVTRPTLALIGEAGPEAVIPLGKGGMGAGVTLNVDARNTGLDAGALFRRASWELRHAGVGS